MAFPKGTQLEWDWETIAPEDMAGVEVGDLKAPTKPLDMAGQKITTLPTPTAGSEPATKEFVESLVQGLDWQESVLGELAEPPASPVAGDRYLVIATATGDWAEHENDIAEWDGAAWAFTTPNAGFAVWIEDTTVQKVWNGTAWVFFGSTINHANITGVTPDQHHPQAHTLGSHSTKAHSELTDIGPSDHHEKTGNYEVFGLTEEVTAVPAPAAENLGRIMRERVGADEVTVVKLCVQNSANTYEWIQLGIST